MDLAEPARCGIRTRPPRLDQRSSSRSVTVPAECLCELLGAHLGVASDTKRRPPRLKLARQRCAAGDFEKPTIRRKKAADAADDRPVTVDAVRAIGDQFAIGLVET